jgi:hypothetical protein
MAGELDHYFGPVVAHRPGECSRECGPACSVDRGLCWSPGDHHAWPVQALFSDSLARQIGGAILVLCGPIFFASVIFIRSFAAERFSGAALGVNLLGALAGGLLESLSLWIGLRSLLLLAALLYLMSYLAQRKVRAVAPELEPATL